MFKTIIEKQSGNSNSGRTCAVDNNLAFFFLFAGQTKSVYYSGENNDSRSVLIIMENRNIENFF